MSIVDNLPANGRDEAMDGDFVLYWNRAGLEFNRLTHSVDGPHTGPTMSSRALAILQLAVHDAYFSIVSSPQGWTTYLAAPGSTADPDAELPQKLGNPTDATQAVAGAAIGVLRKLYGIGAIPQSTSPPPRHSEFRQLLDRFIAEANPSVDQASASFRYGVGVAEKIVGYLAVLVGEPGADASYVSGGVTIEYAPKPERGKFRLDPSNPTQTPHGPFYGESSRLFGVGQLHEVAVPPVVRTVAELTHPAPLHDDAEYIAALREVHRLGGDGKLATTTRDPDRTAAGLYWAYDGANLIGTPPRLYNQIVRQIAWQRKSPNPAVATAEFVRLLALANAAMGDAGVFAWREKYAYEYWRPLSGIREHDPCSGPNARADTKVDSPADPFWTVLGAPRTNTHDVGFKPPFPAYPSGHATFGAAAFQITRLFYKQRDGLTFAADEPDAIAFSFVSDELDGTSRDLYRIYDADRPITAQAGLVRTRIDRHFNSLWAAIMENGASRVYLGVHWRFDAFAGADVIHHTGSDGTTTYKSASDVRYRTTGPGRDAQAKSQKPIGGVPLGLAVADDIWARGLKPPPAGLQRARGAPPPPVPAAAVTAATARTAGPPDRARDVKRTTTNIR